MSDLLEKSTSVEVHFRSLVTGERVTFAMPLDATLEQTWNRAYEELKESKREGDTLQCGVADQGKSLMSDLNLTLREARERRVCGDDAFRYEIKGPSGGAVGY